MRHSRLIVAWAAVCLLLAHSPAPAQLLRIDQGRFYFLAGNAMTSMNQINDRLDTFLDFRIDGDFNTLGAGFYLNLIDNWTLGGEIDLMRSRSEPIAAYKGEYSGRYGYVNIGYLYHSGGGLNIYPVLGLGSAVMNIDITPLAGTVIGNPSGLYDTTKLSAASFNVKVGANVDYMFTLKKNEGGKNWGLVLGFQMAYQVTPMQSRWERSGISLFDDPEFKLKGAFLGLSVGFGWAED